MWSALEPVPQIEELPDGDEKPVGAQGRSEWLMIGGHSMENGMPWWWTVAVSHVGHRIVRTTP